MPPIRTAQASSPSSARMRECLTNEDRIQMRKKRQDRPCMSHYEIRDWFNKSRDKNISLSTVRKILGSSWQWLDAPDVDERLRNKCKARDSNWPVLDKALVEWVNHYQQSMPLTGAILIDQAQRFWERFQAEGLYPSTAVGPKFSNGWIDSFKQRHDIKCGVRNSEAVMGQGEIMDETMESSMESIEQFAPENRYSCDETGLFWQSRPDHHLIIQSPQQRRAIKARVTLQFCCNAQGHQLDPWIIGHCQRPRSFKDVALDRMPFKWRYNKEALMTEEIMSEWLKWFDGQFCGKKVCLIMDRLQAHVRAVRNLAKEGYHLNNMKIIWIPANQASQTSPFVQGVFMQFKALYRTRQARWLLAESMERPDCGKPDLWKAVIWMIESWKSLKPKNLAAYWECARVGAASSELAAGITDLNATEKAARTNLTAAIVQLLSRNENRLPIVLSEMMPLQTTMSIDDPEEIVKDLDMDIFEQIVQRHVNSAAACATVPVESDDVEQQIPGTTMTSLEAIQCLSKVYDWEMRRSDVSLARLATITALRDEAVQHHLRSLQKESKSA